MESSAMGARWQGIRVFFMTNKDTSYKLAPAGNMNCKQELLNGSRINQKYNWLLKEKILKDGTRLVKQKLKMNKKIIVYLVLGSNNKIMPGRNYIAIEIYAQHLKCYIYP